VNWSLLPTSVGFLANPTRLSFQSEVTDAQQAAHALGVKLMVLNASTEGEIDTAFTELSQQRIAALLVGTDVLFLTRRDHACPATNKVRPRDQPQDRQGPRSHRIQSDAIARRRGDRIGRRARMSAYGAKRTSNCRPAMSAFGGKAVTNRTLKMFGYDPRQTLVSPAA